MPPTPHRIAQTSTELKKQHKKHGPRLNERQQKQLERDFELEQRATRAREAEERRKAAKKKREEREAKEAKARQQIGVGLATQLVGYSHTQAQLKNGMEAFLGLKKKKDEEKRKKDLELTRKMEEIAEDIEKEPWDDDDDEDIGLELTSANASFGEQWADDDLDDDTLLEAHDMIMSDPVEESQATVLPPPAPSPSPRPVAVKNDREFTRTHGPINKAIEAVLDKLPEPLLEILSQDLSLKTPDWDPSLGLLHKLNPVGLPPHRLRIKVGCVVMLLRDLNTSSQLSKSQHLRVLRCENDRLECLVLDGQLQGTKTFLTRVPFIAKYKNLDQHPFQRTQFPIRVAVDYTQSSTPRDTSQTGFKLPSIPGRVPPAGPFKKPTLPVVKAKPPTNKNPGFKLPGLPASKSNSPVTSGFTSVAKQTQSLPPPPTDCWDDFLESSTQISRELASEAAPTVAEPVKSPAVVSPLNIDTLPPISTQDFDFSLDDLDEEPPTMEVKCKTVPTLQHDLPGLGSAPLQGHSIITRPSPRPTSLPLPPRLANPLMPHTRIDSAPTPNQLSPRPSATANSSRPLSSSKKVAGRCVNPGPFASGLEAEIAKLRASQLPRSMSGPNAKRKATPTPSKSPAPPVKRQCVPITHAKTSAVVPGPSASFEDFVMSTQEVASFFDDDDDNMSFGSPPIAV